MTTTTSNQTDLSSPVLYETLFAYYNDLFPPFILAGLEPLTLGWRGKRSATVPPLPA
jgi:hypothetical protein